MHYGVLAMENKLVTLGKVAEYIKNHVDIDCSNSHEYVSTENLQSNKLGVSFPSSSYPTSGKVGAYQTGDILISNIRPYFKKIWQADKSGTNSPDVLNIRATSRALTQDFLAVVLSDDRFFDFMMATSKGTKMPRGDKQAIMQYEFILPTLSTQQKVVHIVRAIDTKTELNQQINKNLMKLGIILTVHEINSGRVRVKPLGELEQLLTVSDHVANGSFKSLKENVTIVDEPNFALFLRNKDLKQDLMGDRRWVTEHSYKFLKKSHLHGGEVIISNVGDVGSVHRVPYLAEKMVAGNNVIFMQSDEHWITDYLYLYFRSNIGQHDISAITSGSAQQKFNKTDFRAIKVPFVNESFVKETLTPILRSIDANKAENQSLTQLRDLLLPKLLAGDIDLSNIETVMNNA